MGKQISLGIDAQKRRKGHEGRKALNQLAGSQVNALYVKKRDNKGHSDLPLFFRDDQTSLF